MTKTEAIALLGGTMTSAALRIGISTQAVSNWPEALTDRLADRVQAALYRELLRDAEAKRLRTGELVPA